MTMKSRKVTTVATTEEFVRLDIYEGRIPLGEAGDRLLELALKSHDRMRQEHHTIFNQMRENQNEIKRLNGVIVDMLMPWPVRFYRFLRGHFLRAKNLGGRHDER